MSLVSRSVAYLFSALGHPLLIVIYMLVIYVKVNPYMFPYSHGRELNTLMLIVFFTSFLIPGIAVLLMMGVGFIDSLHMKEKSERIGPLMVTSICYIWLYLNIRTHNAIPIPYANFLLGCIIALFFAFFINNFSKISLHAVGMGGLFIGVMKLFLIHGQEYLVFKLSGQTYSLHYIILIAVLLIVIGVILTSRLYLKAHNNQDIVGGFIVGVIGQLIAMVFF